MFLWRLGKVLGFAVFFVSFVGCWSFFKVQSPTCNFSHGNTSYTVFVKIMNARFNNISSFSKSCLLISTYAGYIMNNKSESICITLHWCSLTSSIAHKHRSLWTAGKQLLQSACILPSKVYFLWIRRLQMKIWIPIHVAKFYFVHYKLYLMHVTTKITYLHQSAQKRHNIQYFLLYF